MRKNIRKTAAGLGNGSGPCADSACRVETLLDACVSVWEKAFGASGGVLLRVSPGPLVSWCYRNREQPPFSVRPVKYVEHGEQAQRSNGRPIVSFDRQLVRKAG